MKIALGEAERFTLTPGWILLSLALTSSLLHVTVSLMVLPAEQHFVHVFLANVAATLLFFIAVCLASWLSVVLLIRSRREGLRLPHLVALSLGAIGFALLYPLVDHSAGHFRDIFAPLALLSFSGLAVIMLLSFSAMSTGSKAQAVRDRFPALVATAPLIAASTLALVWILQTRIDVRNDASGFPTKGAVLALSLYLVLLSAIWFLRRQLRASLVRRTILALLTLGILAAPGALLLMRRAATARLFSASNPKLTNIVLLTVDTLRADAVGAYNPNSRLTPRIDEFSSDSVVFLDARSAAPWTKPAVASMLTGLSPLVHGATTPVSSVPSDLPTLPTILQREGYTTAAIGRNSNLSSVFRFGRGFDTYQMYLGSAVLDNPSVGTRILAAIGFQMTRPSTDTLTDAARDWLRLHKDRPFFLWLHIFDPHTPYSPPQNWLQETTTSGSELTHFDGAKAVRDGSRVLSQAQKRRVRELYDAEVRYVDNAIGRLLDLMRELGLYRDAIIVLSSDHGEEFFEHESIAHGHTLYDEVLKVPLVIKLPGSRVRKRIAVSVSTESLAPTILDLAGMTLATAEFSSRSLTELWRADESPEFWDSTISAGMLFYEERVAIVFEGWKYIRFMDSGREELYSLRDDPHETQSLVESKQDILDRARLRLAEELSKLESLGSGTTPGASADGSRDVPRDVLEDLRALGYLD